MKIRALPVALLPLLVVGCLSPAPEAPTCWTIDRAHSSWPSADIAQTADDVRISRIDVRAPYNGMRLAVLRSDGSVAFDAFNVFAVAPSALLKAAAQDAVRQYGAFKRVLPADSLAKVRYCLEFDIVTLALDCREKDAPKVLVELTATLLEGRNVVGIATVRSTAVANDDYSETFSTAFFHAVADALAQLPAK